MAVSETIQELLQGIDDAQYGRDMRQFIHKGIQKCYEEGSAGETDLVARESIEKILEMFGDVEEGDTASKAYSIGDIVVFDGRLYRVKTAIAQGDEFEEGTNIEETQAAGDTGDAYSIPISAINVLTGLTVGCQLIVMPGIKMMQLCVDVNNTTASSMAMGFAINNLPLLYKDVHFGLYEWSSIVQNSDPLDGVCKIARVSSNSVYTEGLLTANGTLPANKKVYGTITVPYYALSPDAPLSTGTLIDATTDWDA